MTIVHTGVPESLSRQWSRGHARRRGREESGRKRLHDRSGLSVRRVVARASTRRRKAGVARSMHRRDSNVDCPKRRPVSAACLALALCIVVAGGCGTTSKQSGAGGQPAITRALQGPRFYRRGVCFGATPGEQLTVVDALESKWSVPGSWTSSAA